MKGAFMGWKIETDKGINVVKKGGRRLSIITEISEEEVRRNFLGTIKYDNYFIPKIFRPEKGELCFRR
jgi:hypothetical protein